MPLVVVEAHVVSAVEQLGDEARVTSGVFGVSVRDQDVASHGRGGGALGANVHSHIVAVFVRVTRCTRGCVASRPEGW